MSALLDANALIALCWQRHEHHGVMIEWFGRHARSGWSTTALTQAAFVRIEVRVAEACLHCAKALMRSALWSPSARVDRSVLPTMGEMIGSQTGIAAPPETEAEMRVRYAADL